MSNNKNTRSRSNTRSTNYPRRTTKNSSTYVKKASTSSKTTQEIKKKYDAYTKKSASPSSRRTTSHSRTTTTKANYKSYKKPSPKKKKSNINTQSLLIQALVIFVVLLIVLFFIMGWALTLVTALGILFLLALSYFFNKMRKKKWSRRLLNIIIILAILFVLSIFSLGAWFVYTIIMESPEFEVQKLKLKESTLMYDSQGKLMAELGTEKREIIKYEDLSEELINAIIATEDSRFFQHQGFDAVRFAKASLGQLSGNDSAGGGSTLSMQVIKNSFTSKESKGFDGIKRKFTDIYLSIFKLENQFSKQEIIEFYVNNHFLGSNSYGVEQASQTYFGKHASELNLSEAAIIAGMFQAPSSYNPFNNSNATTKRRANVLALMKRHGYITAEEEKIANSIPVSSLLVERTDTSVKFQAYIDTVVDELEDLGYKPYNESLLIYTNMDRSRQQKLDDIFNGINYDWVYKDVQGGIAAVDVNNGKILAIGAGRNRNDARQYNYATMIDRQIGSAAKPIFDYGPGMEYNNWSTYHLFVDAPYQYSSGQPIRNSDGAYKGTLTLRSSLALSRNVPAVKAFQEVDNKKIIEFAQNLGITPEISNGRIHEAHALGAFNGSNPLEMAAAYASFANGGTYYKPYTVNKIVNRQTNEIKEFSSKGVKVMSDSTAFMITDVLKTAVTSGLSGAARVNGINVAAKTGSTNFTKEITQKYGFPTNAVNDAWVVGYDPEVSIAMWYGYPKLQKGKYLTPITATRERAKLFNAAGTAIFKSRGKDFSIPNSVVKVPIEMGSNPAGLASPGTPTWEIVYEYFKKGTEPTEASVKYNKLTNVTGLKVDHDSDTSTTTVSWNAISEPATSSEKYGDFGYKIYKDGKFLGFTTKNVYTIRNDSSPTGTYKVVTSYEIYSANASSGVSVSIDNVSVNFKPSIKTIFNSSDAAYNFSDDVTAKRDGSSIPTTSYIIIKDSITNNTVSWTTAISVANKYVVHYTVYNEGKQIGVLSREIEVKD